MFSPDNFFIQRKDQLETLHEHLTELSRYYIYCELDKRLDELRLPSTDCQLGLWVAAVWDEDNYWYRAKIIKITSLTTVELQFVDFGNRMSCRKSDLYKLAEPFIQENVPAFSSQAKLFGIKPIVGKKYSKAASNLFQSLTYNIEVVGQVTGSNENGKVEVELSLSDGEVNVGDILIKERMALPRIKEETCYIERKFHVDLSNMLDDLSLKLTKCKGPAEYSGNILASIEDLQEEMNELRRMFDNVDEKSVPKVMKHQVKLANKILILGIEKAVTQDKENDENDDDSGIFKG